MRGQDSNMGMKAYAGRILLGLGIVLMLLSLEGSDLYIVQLTVF